MSDIAEELAELLPERTTLMRQGVGINIKRLLKLRGRTMVLLFILLAVPAIAIITLLIPKKFNANATIQFPSAQLSIEEGEGRGTAGSNEYESYIATQIKLIDGWTILEKVANRPDIQELSSIRKLGSGQIFHLQQTLDTETDFLSEFINLTYPGRNGEEARTILQAILDEYEAYLIEDNTKSTNLRHEALLEAEDELKEELANHRQTITQLRIEHQIPAGSTEGLEPTETESNRQNLAQAEADYTTAQTQLRQTEKLIARIENFLENHKKNPQAPIYALRIEERVNQDPNVVLLTEQLAGLQQEYARLEETYQEGMPQLKVKRHELNALIQKIDQIKAQARISVRNSIKAEYDYEMTVAQSDIDDAEERRERFTTLLDEYKQTSLDLSQGLSEIAENERRYTETESRLNDTINNRLRLELERKAPLRAQIGKANLPNTPSAKDRYKAYLIALILIASLAVATGILTELTDQGIRSVEDVNYATSLPVIAAIPHVTEERLPANTNLARIAETAPASWTAEEYRRITAGLLSAHNQSQTCVITSPSRNDGTSTIATNLAITLAQAARKVLLVDLNTRTPSIESNFGFQPGIGLAEMLSGEPLSHNPDRQTNFDNLYVLGPGIKTTNLRSNIASKEMLDFMQGAKELFDHIILDTPSALNTSEAKILAPHVDSIIIVAGAGITNFGMLRRTIDTLQHNKGNLLGIAVNAIKQAPGGYLRKNIQAFYAAERTSAAAPSDNEPSIMIVKD